MHFRIEELGESASQLQLHVVLGKGALWTIRNFRMVGVMVGVG